MSRALRCAACAKRIRPHHPHIGLIDQETGHEVSYHAHPVCQQRAGQEIVTLVEGGKFYILRHYHSSTCPDERPGWGCSGGCFAAPMQMAN